MKIEVRLGQALAGNARSRCILFFESALQIPITQKRDTPFGVSLFWWGRTDSNHRSETQQIYSLSPLATRELPHIHFLLLSLSGAGRRTRTPDLLITNQLLYRLSYTGERTEQMYYTTKTKKVKDYFHLCFEKSLWWVHSQILPPVEGKILDCTPATGYIMGPQRR